MSDSSRRDDIFKRSCVTRIFAPLISSSPMSPVWSRPSPLTPTICRARCARAIWFDGSAVEGFARVAESDMYLIPDLDTFAVLPWEKPNAETGRVARLICDVYTPNGQPFAGDPRGALRRALELAEAMGLRYMVSPELEFYIFRDAPTDSVPFEVDDQAGYFDAVGWRGALHSQARQRRAAQHGDHRRIQPSRGRRRPARTRSRARLMG